MKKISNIILSLILIVMLASTNVFADTKASEEKLSEDFVTHYIRPEAEVYAELEDIAAQKLKNQTAIELFGGGSSTKIETRTVMHHNKAKITYKDAFAAGQLAGGYKANGYLYYDINGGTSYSCSVSFGSPYGSISFGGSTGTKRASVGGLSVKLPSDKYYYKIKAKKGYKSVPYELQQRTKGTKTWTTFSYGVATAYHNVDAYCVKVN